MDNLDDIRKKINGIDAKIADLFEQRMRQSRAVIEYKMANGLSVEDTAREQEVIKRGAEIISDDTIREYYVNVQKDIISASKEYQERYMSGMKVSYSGYPGAFAFEAASRMFPGARLISCNGFDMAYEACAKGESDVAVLPIENSFAGEVSAVTDLMFSGGLFINQVIELEAVQNLLGCEGSSIESITDVVSHPQALSQCAAYIREHGFAQHEYTNTAFAAKMVSEKKDCSLAAVASIQAAELYGLKVLERHINTSSGNSTRFAAFSRVMSSERPQRKMGRHFILMFTVRNEAGALAKTLNIIGAHNFNMYSLRSRPMKELMWNYYFFIELEGEIASAEGESMMHELGSLCDRLKLVGSFNISNNK